jgi:uncharacterized protein DUF4387
MKRTIGDIAKFVTSKNAGPFLLTLDVVLADEATYRRFKALRALDRATVAKLYGIEEDDVLRGGQRSRIPVLIGSAGGGGGRPHLVYTMDVYREICRERGYRPSRHGGRSARAVSRQMVGV